MKKKGLIVATIVMVLVLAVSLTTATYAWFTAASTTKVDAFTFSVANNNDVNIGLKIDNVYGSSRTAASYVSGTVTYSQGTAGTTEGVAARDNAWSGTVNGLSSTIDHSINWGAQSKAVGFSTTGTAGTQTISTLHSFGSATTNNGYVYAASGSSTAVTDVAAAVCNGTTEGETQVKADYVYLPLGIQPNKSLSTCKLIIYVDASSSTASICGMLAALHVAYRVDGDAEITDVQPFGTGSNNTANQSATYATSLSTMSANLSNEVPAGAPSGTLSQQAVFANTFSPVTYQATKTGAIIIDISSNCNTTDDICEVDMWFYLDGSDTDCNQGAVVNITGNMYIFFYTVAAA